MTTLQLLKKKMQKLKKMSEFDLNRNKRSEEESLSRNNKQNSNRTNLELQIKQILFQDFKLIKL